MAKVLGCDPVNNAELKRIRSVLSLERARIAEITRTSKSLVDSWLVSDESPYFRPMPEKSLRLLKLELGIEEPSYIELRREAEERAAAIKGV